MRKILGQTALRVLTVGTVAVVALLSKTTLLAAVVTVGVWLLMAACDLIADRRARRRHAVTYRAGNPPGTQS